MIDLTRRIFENGGDILGLEQRIILENPHRLPRSSSLTETPPGE
jgi:hypothetical protein